MNVPGRSGNINKFSAQFLSQWEKESSWKYYDIWDLVRMGVPDERRVELWKDFLKVAKHEHDAKKYMEKNIDGGYIPGLSPFANLKF